MSSENTPPWDHISPFDPLPPPWTYNEETSEWESSIPLPTLTEEDKRNRMVYRWNIGLDNWELVKLPDNIEYPHQIQ